MFQKEEIVRTHITTYQDSKKYQQLVKDIKVAQTKSRKVVLINDTLDDKYSVSLINFDTLDVISINMNRKEISPQIELQEIEGKIFIKFLIRLDGKISNRNTKGLRERNHYKLNNVNRWYQI